MLLPDIKIKKVENGYVVSTWPTPYKVYIANNIGQVIKFVCKILRDFRQ